MHSHSALAGSFCASRRDFLKVLAVLPFSLGEFRSGLHVRIALVHDGSFGDVLNGARMSLSEIQRAADLLGFDVSASEHTNARDLPDVAGVVAAVREPDALAGIDVPIINTGVAAPRGNVWHIGDVEWDGDGVKFGAAQLNDRYRLAHEAKMSSHAWAGWFAVKVLWEAAVRSRSATPQAIQQFLESPGAAFDGHMGRPLRFDMKTRTLQ